MFDKIQLKTHKDKTENAEIKLQPAEKLETPIILTDDSFSSTIAKHKLMVVDFWAPWCAPCRMVGPIIEELANQYSGRVTFGKLNVDDNPRIPSMFGVQGIPTILVFKDGKAVDTLVGAAGKSYIESKFKSHMEKNA